MVDTYTKYVVCGDRCVKIEVPQGTRMLTANPPVPAVSDIAGSVMEAIMNPIAHDPIGKLVGPKSKVTIAFDDASGAYFQTEREDFRKVAIELIVDELIKLGVDFRNIRLLCAQGLHRKLSRTEMLSTVPCSKFRGASFLFLQFLG